MPKTNNTDVIKLIADRQELLALPKGQLVDLVLMLRDQLTLQKTQIEMLQSQVAALTSKIAALQKNSTNSSKPPSSDLPGTGSSTGSSRTTGSHNRNSRNPSGKKSGGQPGHPGNTRQLVNNPDEVIIAAPNACGGCGQDFAAPGITAYAGDEVIARSQVVDIPPIVPVVTEYQAIARTCTGCGHTTKASLPAEAGCTGTVQIGSNASSLLVYLNSTHHLPYQRLQLVAADLFNLPLSQGSIANKLEQAAIAATPLEQAILDFLHGSPCVGSDETGIRVAGKRIWQWVWQNAKASYYAISKHRDYQTVKDSFGESFHGCLIHDCYSAQNNTPAGWHQLCHAHLLRDLQFVVDNSPGTTDAVWAWRMQGFLIRSQRAREHIWVDGFDPDQKERVIDDYYQQLEQYIRQPLTGTEAIRLQKRFRKHEDKVLYFMTTPDIPPDNNGSERAIRNAKVKQKVSGGYRSYRGAERQALLLSVIETAKKQGLNVLEVIQRLMRGERVWLFGGE
jgi:transposase